MNQEQNNLNPNNFNTQGNNGIPNNQALNNQSFNQGMSFNQQPINPQPQPTPSFQQPINQMNIEQQTPQPMNNTFESGTASNQSFNSKPPKKMNLGLIIGIVAVALVVGSVIAIVLLNNKGEINENSSNSDLSANNMANPEIEMTGKVKLVKKFENYSMSTDVCDNFFVLENEEEKIVVNSVGELIATVSPNYKIKQCIKDGTILVEETTNTYSIHRNNKKIYSFFAYVHYFDSFMYYDNGIIYYQKRNQTTTNSEGVVAYDLNNKQELWKVENSYNPIALDNVVLLNDESKIVSKKTGTIIDQSTDEYEVHGSNSSYYARVYHIDSTDLISKVEIYDYNKNLISTMTFSNKCWFNSIMSNGFYSVSYPETDTVSVYDINSKLIKDKLDTYAYRNGARLTYNGSGHVVKNINVLDNNTTSILESKDEFNSPHLIFYSDRELLEVYSSNNHETGVDQLSYSSYTEQKTFVFGRKNFKDDNWQSKGLLINFKTGQSKEIDDIYSDGEELVNGKYFAIQKRSANSILKFYDSNLNKLDFELETDNKKYTSIKNEWIIFEGKIYNILTGDSYDMDIVDADYYTVNEYGILVRSNNVYYLYQFV